MDWMWKQLFVTWCLANIQWIQLFAGAFIFGMVVTIAILTRRSSLKTLAKVDSLKRTLQETQSSVTNLTKQIKHYHPNGTKCDEECDHKHDTHT